MTTRWRQLGIEGKIFPVQQPVRNVVGLFHGRDRTRRLPSIVSCNVELYRFVLERRPCAIHCNDLAGLWHSFLAAKLARVPIVLSIRGTMGVHGLKWRAARALSDELIVLSRDLKDLVEQNLRPFPLVQ